MNLKNTYNELIMTLILENFEDNAQVFMRNCGYAFQKIDGSEMGFVRRVTGSEYPRYHAYIKMNEKGGLIVNLHIDQKFASYEGSRAHQGDYDSDLVRSELERIYYNYKD